MNKNINKYDVILCFSFCAFFWCMYVLLGLLCVYYPPLMIWAFMSLLFGGMFFGFGYSLFMKGCNNNEIL